MNQHDRPTASELIEAVREFLLEDVRPRTSGRLSFHALVAANALAAVERELSEGPALVAETIERLEKLLDVEGRPSLRGDGDALAELERALCLRIQRGELGLADEDLLLHLDWVTRRRLAIDNPRYRTVDQGF